MVALEEKNILLDCTASDYKEAIHLAVGRLRENGYVGDRYEEEVLNREKNYPTGLPCDDVSVAMPHAFSDDVLQTGIALLKMKEPVAFHNMIAPDDYLPCELVFVLANASGSDAHLEELQELMNCFTRQGFLLDMKKAETPAEIIKIFSNREQYPEL